MIIEKIKKFYDICKLKIEIDKLKSENKKIIENNKKEIEKILSDKQKEFPVFNKSIGSDIDINKLSYIEKLKLKFLPKKSYLITMIFSNSTVKQFVISTHNETFEYGKRTYYLLYDKSYMDLNYKISRLFYHDDSPVPIDKKIIKQGAEAFFSVTPENLKPLVKMEYIKAITSSTEISQYLKMALVFSGFSIFISVIILTKIWN